MIDFDFQGGSMTILVPLKKQFASDPNTSLFGQKLTNFFPTTKDQITTVIISKLSLGLNK